MKKIILITGIIALLVFISSCEEPVEQDKSTNFDVTKYKPYVDLYFFNSDSFPNDPIFVQDYELNKTYLKVIVGYSGCSGDHPVELVWLHPSCGTPPIPPPTFNLRHDRMGQLCEMYITDTLYFNLEKMIESTQEETLIQFCYQTTGDNYKCDSLYVVP